MTTVIFPESAADSPPPFESHTLPGVLLLGVHSTGSTVIHFVAKFDPAKHPHGYKGLFINTPDADKSDIKHTNVGDVIAAKSGKVFQIAGHGPKGVKVNSVDRDSGEVLPKGTVISHGVEVAVIDKAKAVGSIHGIGDLQPGTYVQHPKSGKRFVVSKHGKWTTVYPVDEGGNVSGKHTVLPMDTSVLIVPKSVTGDVSPQVVQAVAGIKQSLGLPPLDMTHTKFREAVWTELASEMAGGDELLTGDLFDDIFHRNIRTEGEWNDYVNETLDSEAWGPEGITQVQGLWQSVYQAKLDEFKSQAPMGDAPAQSSVPPPPDALSDPLLKQQLFQLLSLGWANAVGDESDFMAKRLQNLDEAHPDQPFDGLFDFQLVVRSEAPHKLEGFSSQEMDQWAKTTATQIYDHAYKSVVDAYEQQWHAAQGPKSVPQQVQEQLPSKLPKVPKPYPPGAGKDTRIVIDTGISMHDAHTGFALFQVWRRGPGEETGGQLLGVADGISKARSLARANSGSHEAIEQKQQTIIRNAQRDHVWKIGDWALQNNGDVIQIESVEEGTRKDWKGNSIAIIRIGYTHPPDPHAPYFTEAAYLSSVPLDEAQAADAVSQAQEAGNAMARLSGDVYHMRLHELGWVKSEDPVTLRKPRPNKYVSELQDGWSLDELQGKPVAEAQTALQRLGWREIRPREQQLRKYINARGLRLDVQHNGKSVSAVEEPKITFGTIAGAGTASDLYYNLEEALVQGADLSVLDPRSAVVPAARNSHVQGLLHDLAVGKQNGVEKIVGMEQKVKSDEAYRQEIEAEAGKSDHPLGPPVESMDHYLQIASLPSQKVQARGGMIDAWGLHDSPYWDFGSKRLSLPEEVEPMEWAAMYTLLNNYGATEIVQGTSGRSEFKASPTLTEQSVMDGKPDLERASIALAAAYKQYLGGDSAGFLDELDDTSRGYLAERMAESVTKSIIEKNHRDDQRQETAKIMREADMQTEINNRRQTEGTVKTAMQEYELPLWDKIDMQPQEMADIEAKVADLEPGFLGAMSDIPAFYSAGLAKDGIVYYKPGQADLKIPLENDEDLKGVMQKLGAVQGANRHPIDPGYSGSYELHNGTSLVYEVPGEASTLTFDDGGALSQESKETIRSTLENRGLVESYRFTVMKGVDAITETSSDNADAAAKIQTFIKDVMHTNQGPGAAEQAWQDIEHRHVRSIEYIPHEQAPTVGAPTSQRGRLSFYGYQPAEVDALLKELGIMGSLEPEVPFTSVMRSSRRQGVVAPLHSAYVRGEAPLPSSQARVSHGLTGGGHDVDEKVTALEGILSGGGLLSIEQRYRAGILKKIPTTSSAGDIRSGIDHAVFGTLGVGGACGGGSPVKILAKPSVLLRRDIVMAPDDYGGAATRYPKYRAYLNKLQSEAGEQKTNLYEPVSPKVRQNHLNDVYVHGSNEFNVGPGIAVEDMAMIEVPGDHVDRINALLDKMLADGRIVSRPVVTTTMAELADTPIQGT